ncbi:MAG TPA: TIGR03032 family protein [Gaiellaceae bacterium]|jgi:uncharacterized protein (TIGR03032 family)|nr:TIGR03032 family protein [Gaiellaceae bacterium]
MTEIADAAAPEQALEITVSEGFEAWLASQGTSLVFATPPAKIFLVGLDAGGEVSIYERTFNKCMGIAQVDSQTIYLGTRHELWRLENVLRPGELTDDGYDRLFVPLESSATGYLNTHDLGVQADGGVLFVNTRFGCLAAPSDTHSFVPVWWPPFLPGPWPNDRCHLNGLAMKDGRAAHVTTVSQTVRVDGWRNHRRDGGTVIDVASNEIVATGLSMPHSPRWYRDRLWVANAGSGELGTIDLQAGRFEPMTFAPGFVRGLCFSGDYAVLGSSKPRHGDLYSGLALDGKLEQAGESPQLGLFVISLLTGEIVEWLLIDGPVRELFEVVALPGVRRPKAIGIMSDEIASLSRFDSVPGLVSAAL